MGGLAIDFELVKLFRVEVDNPTFFWDAIEIVHIKYMEHLRKVSK